MEIDIQIEDAFSRDVAEDWLREVATAVLRAQRVPEEMELGVVIAGDETVAALNQQYRGVEGTTDVLSFSLMEAEEPFIGPPDSPPLLGDVIISYQQAQRQAPEWGNTVPAEVARLLAHGTLHLLGYDHELPADRARMRRRERAIMALLEKNWAGPRDAAS